MVKVLGNRWNAWFFEFFRVSNDISNGIPEEGLTDRQFTLWERVFEGGLGGIPVGDIVELTTLTGGKLHLLRVEDSEEPQEIDGVDTWDLDISHQFLHDGSVVGVLEIYDLLIK